MPFQRWHQKQHSLSTHHISHLAYVKVCVQNNVKSVLGWIFPLSMASRWITGGRLESSAEGIIYPSDM